MSILCESQEFWWKIFLNSKKDPDSRRVQWNKRPTNYFPTKTTPQGSSLYQTVSAYERIEDPYEFLNDSLEPRRSYKLQPYTCAICRNKFTRI